MAEQALKKLEDQLNCLICLETYTDPKQLNCQHVYCQQCLVQLVVQDQQGQFSLTCPKCRQVTPVPASGVADLQAAFQINQFLEIVEEHKMAKNAIASAEKVENASASHTGQSTTVGCPEHGGREVELYCETCEKTICFRCIKKGEKHNNHDYEELDEAFEKYKEEITSSLEPMEKQLVTIKRALTQLDARCEEITNQQVTIEKDIHTTIERLHQTLEVRRTELIGQLHRLTQDKLKRLAVQRDQIETTQARLSSCLHYVKENLKTGNQGEALMMKSTTVRQINELTTTFQPDLLEPIIETDTTFSAIADITAVIQNYGRVHNKYGPTDHSKCTVSGKGVELAIVGEKSTVLLQTLSFDNLPSKDAINTITCGLVSELTGTRVGGSVERTGQSQYQISYGPTIKGRHQLHIKVEGQHIRGSPFPVTAITQVEKLGTPILIIGGVKGSWGVATNQRGEVVVTQEGGHCVSVFSPSGKRLQSFGTRGSDLGQFNFPYGVAVDGEGCILVIDRNNHRIQKFTAEGKFLMAAGTRGNGYFQFYNPSGIVYNAGNDMVYVGDLNCRIRVLNSDLSYASSFGQRGSGKGQFSNPLHLAVDSTGNVYVADCGNNRIQVFTAGGKFVRMFGKFGEGRGQLQRPCGIGIHSNRVYVSEFSNNCVSVFTCEGQFVTSFGKRGSGPGEFSNPTGVAVDSSGEISYQPFSGRHQLHIIVEDHTLIFLVVLATPSIRIIPVHPLTSAS